MARRIIWTSKADIVLTEILEFYVARNKSKVYSRQLNKEINGVLKLLATYPFLGLKSDIEDIRVFVRGHFKIFYELKPDEIIVHLVWDTRQNPNELKI